jgi:hypothetical protein
VARSTDLAARGFTAALLACFLPLCFAGEKIGINQGYGFDGALFGPMARDIPAELPHLSLYRQQRLLPPALVYFGHVALGLPTSDNSVVASFVLLAALCVGVAGLLWVRVASALGLSGAALWLGGIGIFANFGVLKMLAYYPVLVDGPTLVLGLAALCLWLERRDSALPPLALASAFVSSTAVLFLLPLLLFPRQDAAPLPARGSSAGGLALVAAAACLALAALDPGPWVMQSLPRERVSLALSVLMAATWVFLGIRPLVRAVDVEALPALVRRHAARTVSAVVTLGLIAALAQAAPAPNEYPLNIGEVGPRLFARALWHPGGFAVSHVLYFGPIVALAVWRWSAVAAVAGSFGPALPALLALTAVAALNSESRHHIFVLPLVAGLTARALDDGGLSGRRVALFGLVALLASRAWQRLGEVPGEAYWISFGPWWNDRRYHISLAFAAATSVAALLALRPRR